MDTGAILGVLCVSIVGGYPTIRAGMTVGVLRPVLVGLVAQGIVAIALMIVVGLWAPDALKYHSMGQELAEYLRGGPEPTIAVGDGKEGFPSLLGGLYWLFGPHASVGIAVNWVAHGALVVSLAAAARRLSLPARSTAWIVALFPPLLFWGGLLLRDSLAWLLIALVILGLVIFAKAERHQECLKGAALVLVALLALSVVRGSAAIIIWVAAAIVLTITVRLATALPRLLLVVAMFTALLPQILPIVGAYLPDETTQEPVTVVDPPWAPAPPALMEPDTPDDALSRSREALSRDATTSFAGPDSNESPGLVSAASRVAAGPFPWEWGHVGPQVIADGALWLALLVVSVLGVWRRRSSWRSLLVLAVPAALLLGALVVTSGNYGTMQRLRLQSTVLLIPIAAAGLHRRERGVSAESARPVEGRVAADAGNSHGPAADGDAG